MLGKRYGVCCNPVTGAPDRVYMNTVKLGWLRSLVLDLGSFQALYDQVPTTTNIAAVITGQSGNINNDWWSDGWRERFETFLKSFCERYYQKVRLIEFTNEWDFWHNTDRASKAVEISVLGTNICKEYGILGFLGSVASGNWQAELNHATTLLQQIEQALGHSAVHGFAFHPYVSYVERERGDTFIVPSNAQPWERMSDKISRAIEISGGRTCAITEFGIKKVDAGTEERQALWVHGAFEDELARFTPHEVLMASLFCWDEANGSPGESGDQSFGLINRDGTQTPAYNAATYQFRHEPETDLPVQELIAKGKPTPHIPTPKPEPPVPVPQPQPQRPLSVDDAHRIRWQAIVSHAPYNPDFGFERAWRQPDNRWWGSPLTEGEFTLEDGRPVRVFANAVVAYNAGDGTTEVLG